MKHACTWSLVCGKGVAGQCCHFCSQNGTGTCSSCISYPEQCGHYSEKEEGRDE